MRNIKLMIEYDGTNYYGWQKQQEKATVQGEIERILEIILKEKIEICGSGRTDAGVHALAQTANFKTEKAIKCEELYRAINSIINKDIAIIDIQEVDENFDARKSAKSKHYRYVVNNSDVHSALNYNREYNFKYNLDIKMMKLAAHDLIGRHDFKAFMATGSTIRDTNKEIYDIEINKVGTRIIIDVVGSGFLYNMVRIIVGTLLDIGAGKLDVCTIKNMIETGNRSMGGQTVPGRGLYLVSVGYN